MTIQILSGTDLSHTLRQEVASQIAELKTQYQIQPNLTVILVGNHPPSEIYVHNKLKACQIAGIDCQLIRFDESVSEKALIAKIEDLNQDQSVHGILIQLPLPQHIHVDHIIECIDPNKDVDGFHPHNLGLLALGIPRLRACTPFGIMQLLQTHNIHVKGKDVLMIGLSRIVGLPMTFELLMDDATVTCAHRETKKLQDKIKTHEIVIVATGHRDLIQKDSFRKDHIIVDVGIHRINNKVCGDVDFDEAVKVVKAITPVPGGVGPMTITALLQNIVAATKLQFS